MIKGRIHAIETMGLHDGPGIRTVFFMQGCPLRCKYCHNPDALSFKGGQVYTVDELVMFAKRYKSYYKTSGGVTFSGGEALMQGAFLLEAIKALKNEGIHVALDTSGIGQSSYFNEILSYVDMVIMDVKHVNKNAYKDLTGLSMKRLDAFHDALQAFNGQIWVRHVMLPGYTDNLTSMDALFNYISLWHKKIEKIEILPYHKLGVDKYYQLGLEDPLKDIDEMDSSIAKSFELYLMKKLKKLKIAV